MKCEVCGEEAGFFTETYDPMTKRNRTVWLCEHHQADMFRRIDGAIFDMIFMLKYERGKVRGILPTECEGIGIAGKDISDAGFSRMNDDSGGIIIKSYNNVKGLFDEEPTTFSWDDFKTARCDKR